MLRDYYFMVYPPKKSDEDEDDFATFGDRVVNFDKLSVRRRALMRNDWHQESKEGDLV